MRRSREEAAAEGRSSQSVANPGPTARVRLTGVDAGRYLAFIAVVFIHTMPQATQGFGVNWVRVVDQLCRFAVPFFFLASGFFYARRGFDDAPRLVLSILKRILPVFLFWALFYIAVTNNFDALTRPYNIAVMFLSGGPGYHLWFLPALGVSLTAVAVMKRFAGWVPVMCITAALYLAGLAIGSYGAGQDSMRLAIARVFCGPIFVLMGAWLSQSGWRLHLKGACLVLLAGAAIQLLEAYLLDVNHINMFHKNDFLIGTLPLGLGAFLIALNVTSQSKPLRVLATLGTYSFGMYAVHLYFVFLILRNLGGVLRFDHLSGQLHLPFLVIIASTLFSVVLARIGVFRFLLT